MAQALWKGALSFGLVNVPVWLYAATKDQTIQFHQIQQGTNSRIRYQRVNEDTGREVAYDDIVKAFPAGDGEYVAVTSDELAQVAPGRSETIDITDFIEANDIDPIYYRNTYYLAPAGKSDPRAYQLLTQAMADAKRIAIGNFVMRSKQYLAAIRPYGESLLLETLYFADEVRAQDDIMPSTDQVQSPGRRDQQMAHSLIESMSSDWDPAQYEDTYREQVLALIRQKQQGAPAHPEADEQYDDNVLDLSEALRKSVQSSRPRRQQRAGTARPSAGSGQQELETRTRNELYEMASKYEISGRSSMNKRDLAGALAQVEEADAG